MIEILLLVHLVIAILLIIVILVQKTSADGVSGIGGNNLGVISGRSANDFLMRTTIILATAFILNSLILANLSTKKSDSFKQKIESNKITEEQKGSNLPIAK